ncbi:hypothetical protein DI270_021365 [Microbispora triticiradicis]|uniref:XRE family transcriptional regulator n=1 Tax=Microbispora triticiradicis TaxID=2200763 RepID=A0ABX9LGA0_9ACTN|nr:hypothetical protein [Microbispora triticiradicis]RGA03000.1 hypothetical protein DI270_021365 [Microbispora triticiradicis]
MLTALKARDIGAVFRLVRQYGGLSQTAIGSLTGYSQGKVSAIMSGLAAALTEYPVAGPQLPELPQLATAVARAKRTYQACRYSEVAAMLPMLIRSLRLACATLDGDARLKAHALSAEAHHVAASILLKQEDKGHTTAELLDEAEDAGRRLGYDGNHMWSAFGPNNVLCHRVNIALSFGDAGTAIENARRIDINALPINERKATVLLDTSRAFLAWGKHDRALYILRAAGDIAPEEITSRPATHRLVRDILATAPISIRREAREYAESLGVTA